MPDRRRHRGPHPHDPESFAPAAWPALRQAVADLAWLLGRGYAETAALKLVGDRYRFRKRQRIAVLRSTCTDEDMADRCTREVGVETATGKALAIDGYNALITVEAALAGGVLLLGRDGCLRDLASIHGSFRRVEETDPALGLLGEALAGWGIGPCTWYLDRPVSNSGRLAARMRRLAQDRDFSWDVELVTNPDRVLARAPGIVSTADSVVLDRCGAWFNLARRVVADRVHESRWIDLATPPG